jgi:2-polyprenyl-3-methyl-5-hydroxy-6-metoxy-1,4-benzoquinol methylase
MTERTATSAAQVRKLFDAKAATWSAKYAPGGRLTGRLAQFLTVVEERTETGARVLDLGCGTGDLALSLAAANRRVTGCDISVEMVDRAAQADEAQAVEWTRLDPSWQMLPFRDGAFSAIVASSVLEYLDDPASVLRECARILQPGGMLLCSVPDLRHPTRWLEYITAVVTRGLLGQALGHRGPRLGSYVTYLRISRQRHSSRWWRTTAACADLRPSPASAVTARRAPLLLLDFVKPKSTGQL